MKSIAVSVIVTVYKTELYLEKCLDSLVNQTLKNIEIVIVNDGSPDNSQEIIDRYKALYPEKITVIQKQNGGQSDATNCGIRVAKGDYLAFMGSDDYADLTMYEKLYNVAVSNNVSIAACNYVKVFKSKKVKEKIVPEDLRVSSVRDNPEILFFSKVYFWNKVIRKDIFIENNIFFPVGCFFDDSAIAYNILYLADKIAWVDEYLYYYLQYRPDAITKTVDDRIFDIFTALDSIVNFYSKLSDYKEKYYSVICRLCQLHAFVRASILLKSDNKKLAFEFFDKMFLWFGQNYPDWKKYPYYSVLNRSKKIRIKYYLYHHIFYHHKLLLKLLFYLR